MADQPFNHFAALAKSLHQEAAQVVSKTAHDVLAGSQDEVPVDTGALKNSGHVEDGSSDLEKYIVYSMDYAEYVHDGTVHQAPNPFLARPAERIRPGFVQAMVQIRLKA